MKRNADLKPTHYFEHSMPYISRGDVLFLTQAWALLKWKSNQLHISIAAQFPLPWFCKSLLSCQINVKLSRDVSVFQNMKLNKFVL